MEEQRELKGVAKEVFANIVKIYKLDDSALYLARIISVAWSHMLQAEEILDREGLIITNQYGDPKVHAAKIFLEATAPR